tara:strand:- start:119 stop:3835 length:3717 start_codon:yes stop_codon:yes gene_type:complete
VIKASTQTGAVVRSTTLLAASSTKVLTVGDPADITVGNGVIGTGVKTGTVVESIDGADITVNKVQNLGSGVAVVFVGLETSMYDVSNRYLYDDPGDEATYNPYYDSTYGGDPEFLQDKFVRFSYRFQFVDGENSIYAPFTQPCFIPQQDGYFIENFNNDTDEAQTLQTTIVDFMVNKVTKIDLQIPLPAYASELVLANSPFKIKAIDILYKESDGLAVQVVDTVLVDSNFGTTVGQNDIYEYTYESTKPFKTLPSKELIRVYDKIPVRAFSQEVISNRVVYGNFQDKHTPPASLDYQVNVSDKYPVNGVNSNKTIVEYPNSSLKQNRNYQVGIVLSDKFGRQSSTILSNNTSPLTATGFGASTVFSDYQTELDTAPALWPGDSLKILFNEIIDSQRNLASGTPGIYNGDSTSAQYNPLGWYSYKVVVQQKQQDYYNVYNAGAMRGSPINEFKNVSTSYISLINDNINKVPRDLTEVGPLQKQFRSSVRLIGRVENTAYSTATILYPAGNKQFYPGRLADTTSSIEDLNSIFDVDGYVALNPGKPISTSQNPFYPFYKSESDPLIAQITTTKPGGFGLPNIAGPSAVYEPIENLCVFETEPDLSRLDFYFETSTSGLISELNSAIVSGTGGAYGMGNWSFNQTEASDIGDVVVGNFYPTDLTGVAISSSIVELIEVRDADNVSRNITEWALQSLGVISGRNEYNLRSNAYQYYGPGANTNQSWVFTFKVIDTTAGATITNVIETGQLANIAPTINGGTSQTIVTSAGATGIFNTQSAVNGAIAAGGQSTQNLTWSKIQGDSNFTINSITGELSNSNSSAAGSYPMQIRVTDAGGAFQTATLSLIFGNALAPANFTIPKIDLGDGDMITYYFTNPAAPYTSLDGNNHAITNTQYRQSTTLASTPSAGNDYKQGYLCSGNKYLWKKQYRGDWFEFNQNAAFYVEVNTTNSTSLSTTNTFASVEWKGENDTEWVVAKDINGELAYFGMTTIPYYNSSTVYDKQIIGFQAPIGSAGPGPGGIDIQMVGTNGNINQPNPGDADYYGLRNPSAYQTVVQNSNGVLIQGNRIFAFNGIGTNANGTTTNKGQYRITLGNFSSSVSNGYPSCPGALMQYGTKQSIELGDANYPDGIAGVYEYEVTKTFIGDALITQSMSSANVDVFYAREWITKYVTQFYTDATLTQKVTYPAGGPVEGYRRKFRRTGTNQEGTLDNSYLARVNDQGLREVNPLNIPTACINYGLVGP